MSTNQIEFTPKATEAYTNKPAMILTANRYVVRGDDGKGYLLCAGTPEGDDSETELSFSTWRELVADLKRNNLCPADDAHT